MHGRQGPPHDGRHDPRPIGASTPDENRNGGREPDTERDRELRERRVGHRAVAHGEVDEIEPELGASANETPMSTTLAPAPIAAARHSPRRGCHHQPIAAVIFVTSSIAQTRDGAAP